MMRTALLCGAMLVGGYLLTGWILRPLVAPASKGQAAAAIAEAGSSTERLTAGGRSAPSAERQLPARPAAGTNIGPKLRCEGDLTKLPDVALARMPFPGGRPELQRFVERHPSFVKQARSLTENLLREERNVAQSCFRQAAPTGPVPMIVEWRLSAGEGRFSLSSGSVLQAKGDPQMVELARRCLAPMLAKSWSVPLPPPPPGEPAPVYDGALPWPMVFGP